MSAVAAKRKRYKIKYFSSVVAVKSDFTTTTAEDKKEKLLLQLPTKQNLLVHLLR